MSWLLGGIYCGILWLVFAKLKLIRLTLPIALLAASIGPGLILVLLFCAQYYHPYTAVGRVYQQVIQITPQLRQAGRVTRVVVRPNVPVKKGEVLFQVDAIPYENSITQLKAALEEAKQSQAVAEAAIDLAQATIARTDSDLKFARVEHERKAELVKTQAISQEEFDAITNTLNSAESSAVQSQATLIQAQSSVALAMARVEQTAAQLAGAEYDLAQTVVYAPSDGFVTNLNLREGVLVGGAGGSSVMSFVQDRGEYSQGTVVGLFSQKNYLRIQPGQYAEVALYGYPGQIFTGRVENVIDISGDGQLPVSGILPSDLGGNAATGFAVRVKLDEGNNLRLPGGSQAQVAVYTEEVQIAGIPVMFLMRAQSWLRYIM
ncbi:HlyD family secretion protein [Aureliella helgolandensis]|uniref:Inner membrane protein YiaV n=1 Tax=Aureliella helgolandensis TaxID=2527968 RepID=A0A518G9X8_9BACT|nr:biotin/lipoyl-binding protein [Aureliella helgolandensis]QDV25380.1 Inner membrane protein YiaV precursor [Aureliella helgolandensis]